MTSDVFTSCRAQPPGSCFRRPAFRWLTSAVQAQQPVVQARVLVQDFRRLNRRRVGTSECRLDMLMVAFLAGMCHRITRNGSSYLLLELCSGLSHRCRRCLFALPSAAETRRLRRRLGALELDYVHPAGQCSTCRGMYWAEVCRSHDNATKWHRERTSGTCLYRNWAILCTASCCSVRFFQRGRFLLWAGLPPPADSLCANILQRAGTELPARGFWPQLTRRGRPRVQRSKVRAGGRSPSTRPHRQNLARQRLSVVCCWARLWEMSCQRGSQSRCCQRCKCWRNSAAAPPSAPSPRCLSLEAGCCRTALCAALHERVFVITVIRAACRLTATHSLQKRSQAIVITLTCTDRVDGIYVALGLRLVGQLLQIA